MEYLRSQSLSRSKSKIKEIFLMLLSRSLINVSDYFFRRRDSESSSSSSSSKRKLSALEEIKMEEEERKRKFSSSLVSAKEEPDSKKDYWLKRNIVVKIITKRLGDK